MAEQVDTNVKVGVLAAIGAVGATLMTHWLTKKREIEARHFEKKRECYESIMHTFGQLFTPEDARKKISDRQLTQAIINHRKEIAVWADADLIKWWLHMSNRPSDTLSTKEALLMGENLIRTIRKELGKDDSQIESGHLIALFLKEPPEEVARTADFINESGTKCGLLWPFSCDPRFYGTPTSSNSVWIWVSH